jgi:hypothetical protein
MTLQRPMFPPRVEWIRFCLKPFINSDQKNGKWSLPCWDLSPAV